MGLERLGRDCSVQIQGTQGPGSGALHHVEISHGGGYVGVAEQVLGSPYVDSLFQQVGSEGMAEGVKGHSLGESGLQAGVGMQPENAAGIQGVM